MTVKCPIEFDQVGLVTRSASQHNNDCSVTSSAATQYPQHRVQPTRQVPAAVNKDAHRPFWPCVLSTMLEKALQLADETHFRMILWKYAPDWFQAASICLVGLVADLVRLLPGSSHAATTRMIGSGSHLLR